MIDFSKLTQPFPASDVEWRLQECGEKNGKVWAMCLAYITNRAIMQRLDDVCGAENWKNEYRPGPQGGVICGISIKCGDEWVTKWDGADNTAVEATKGGLSDAMKRAGVQWGIGRYLYSLESGFANVCDNGEYRGKTKTGTMFKWNAPALPKWALPGNTPAPAKAATPPPTPAKITRDQQKRLFAEMGKVVTGDELKAQFKITSSSDITAAQFDEVLKWVAKRKEAVVNQQFEETKNANLGELKKDMQHGEAA